MNRRMELVGELIPMELHERNIPRAPPSGLIVKVHFAGVCHSDVHIWKSVTKRFKDFVFPAVLGHEISGEVYELGQDPPQGSDDLSVGDRVIVYPWSATCLKCDVCRGGCHPLCTAGVSMGVRVDGGYQNFVSIADRSIVHKVPIDIPMDVACLVPCSGITAYNAICRVLPTVEHFTKLTGQSSLLICGAGGLGLWGVGIAKAILPPTTTVYVSDISESKLNDAKKAGADITLLWDPKVDDAVLVDEVKQKTDGGVNAICDFVGAQGTFEKGLKCLRKGGILNLIGLGGGTVPITSNVMCLMNLTVCGIYVGEKSHLGRMFDLISQKKILPPPITHYKLEDVNDVIQSLNGGKINGRAIVKMMQ